MLFMCKEVLTACANFSETRVLALTSCKTLDSCGDINRSSSKRRSAVDEKNSTASTDLGMLKRDGVSTLLCFVSFSAVNFEVQIPSCFRNGKN